MTRKKEEAKLLTELNISRDDAKAKLDDRIAKGHSINQIQINTRENLEKVTNDFYKWDSYNTELLKRIFTTEELANEYSSWAGGSFSIYDQSIGEEIADLHKNIDYKIHQLDSIIERLELIPLVAINSIMPKEIEQHTIPKTSKKVFVVHGHDEVAKTNLEVFLTEIGLEPVVLHRQADEGLTIIEKFEKHSDVGYAFILLTPDEIAYLKADDVKNDEERNKELRARPNVIFEFGYFVGKLGRSKVCCLYTGNVSLPSDISGMIYKKYTTNIEEVAYSIMKDLKASGYTLIH